MGRIPEYLFAAFRVEILEKSMAAAVVLPFDVIVAPTISSASSKTTTATSKMNLRAAIDRNMVELKTIFPNLQGVGTLSRHGEILLTIFNEHSTPEAEEDDADAAAKLLGVPVRVMVVPARLERQPAR